MGWDSGACPRPARHRHALRARGAGSCTPARRSRLRPSESSRHGTQGPPGAPSVCHRDPAVTALPIPPPSLTTGHVAWCVGWERKGGDVPVPLPPLFTRFAHHSAFRQLPDRAKQVLRANGPAPSGKATVTCDTLCSAQGTNPSTLRSSMPSPGDSSDDGGGSLPPGHDARTTHQVTGPTNEPCAIRLYVTSAGAPTQLESDWMHESAR